MISDTSQSTRKTEKTYIEWFNCKLGTKCDENIIKLADAPVQFLPTPQARRLNLVAPVSLQNTTMTSNMILDTSYNIQQVKKMVFKCFQLQIRAKIGIFAFFSI